MEEEHEAAKAQEVDLAALTFRKINLLPEGISEVTGEIGTVRVTGYESKGRINKRIRIEVTG